MYDQGGGTELRGRHDVIGLWESGLMFLGKAFLEAILGFPFVGSYHYVKLSANYWGLEKFRSFLHLFKGFVEGF